MEGIFVNLELENYNSSGNQEINWFIEKDINKNDIVGNKILILESRFNTN